PPRGGDTPALSDLSAHLQMLTLVRQDTHDRVLDRAFVALMTVAERVNLFAAMADAAVRHAQRPDFARLLQPQLDALLDAIDYALGRYAAAAWVPESVVVPDDAALHIAADWPDFSALYGAVQTRHADPAMRAALPDIDVAAAGVLNGFLQALDGLSDVLHLPPESLEHLPPEGPHPTAAPLLPPFDPFAFQFALKIGLATVLSLIVGIVSHAPRMETVVLNPLILAQGSYGATLRKAWLRVGGVVAGGALAVLIAASVMPNTGDVGVWLLVFFFVLLPCAYIALGTVRFGYFGLQIAATFMIVMVADRPVTDTNLVLWRFWGTLVGAALLFGLFEIVAPDYAGRQMVSRIADLIRALLASAPVPGQPVPPLARTQALSDQITAGLADVLRLAGEARFEGSASGVDAEAAVNSAGLLRRIAHRWALIRRARRHTDRPPLPPALAEASAALERAGRERLTRLLRILEARHHRARPGSRRHHAACAAAHALASRPPCDLAAPWRAYRAAFESSRETFHAWPIAAREAIYAESGHLQRIVELLPKLEIEVSHAVLPGAEREAPAEWRLRTQPAG
ncbi:MAG: FUSC family protein, partial [Deltaproteobacteria bacterium]|nr:FUSC family protein [Deltaproteobacteria bacterium]